MQFDVITLFPEMFSALSGSGITRRAFEENRCSLTLWNPRDFTHDKHRTVDDRPYGGGPGMVMMARPLEDAIVAAKKRLAGSGVADAAVIIFRRKKTSGSCTGPGTCFMRRDDSSLRAV